MVEINNYRDVEFVISLINLIQEKYGGYDYISKVDEMKRELRKFYKNYSDEGVFVVKHDDDGYVEKLEVPERCLDRDSMEMWFKGYVEIEPINSAYGCTGCPFTSWHRFIKLHGTWYCYHRVCYDI